MSLIPSKLLEAPPPSLDLAEEAQFAQFLLHRIRRGISSQKANSIAEWGITKSQGSHITLPLTYLKKVLAKTTINSTLQSNPLTLSKLTDKRTYIKKLFIKEIHGGVNPVRSSIQERTLLYKTIHQFKNLKSLEIRFFIDPLLLRRIVCLNQLETLAITLPLHFISQISHLPDYFRSLKKFKLGFFVQQNEMDSVKEDDLHLIQSFFDKLGSLKGLQMLDLDVPIDSLLLTNNRILEMCSLSLQKAQLTNYRLSFELESLQLDWSVIKENLSNIDFLYLSTRMDFFRTRTLDSRQLQPILRDSYRAYCLKVAKADSLLISTLLGFCHSLKTLHISSPFLNKLEGEFKLSTLENLFISFQKNEDPNRELKKLLWLMNNSIQSLNSFFLRNINSDRFDSPLFQKLFESPCLSQLGELSLGMSSYLFSVGQNGFPFKHLESLKRLDLAICASSLPSTLFETFPNLQNLDLMVFSKSPNFEIVVQLNMKSLPELKTLTLNTTAGRVSRDGAKELLEGFKKANKLESLKIFGRCVTKLENHEIEKYADELVKMKSLQNIRISADKSLVIQRRKFHT